MSFVRTMQRALAAEIAVRTWWGCCGISCEAFRRWFLERLDARINREDRRPWRKLAPDYQTALRRDARRVREIIQQRIIHRQFETDLVKAHLGHLLSPED